MLKRLLRLLLIWCGVAPVLVGCASLGGIGPTSYYRVTLNSLSHDRYVDIYSGVVFTTRACVHIAVMENAIFVPRLSGGVLYFKNGDVCIVN